MSKAELKETIGCSKKFKVEIERERLDAELSSTLKRLKHGIQIPGFRKGKAPESMISRRFGGLIREEAIKDLVPKVIQEVFEEQGVKSVGEPEISDFTFEEASPITFTLTVEEMPSIDISGFERLKVTKEVYEVTDKDLARVLERMRKAKAERVIVERGAREGDGLVVNLQKLDVSGVPIIGEKIENHLIALDGNSTPSPEFDRQVLGMKAGETKTVRFTYDGSINNPNLVGKTEAYTVKVVNVIETITPELTDDFARSLTGGYEDLNDLRGQTHANLKETNEFYAEKRLEYVIVKEFIKEYPFEVPNSLVEKILKSYIDIERKNSDGEHFDEEEFRNRERPDAVRSVQTHIIRETVKQQKNIEVSKEEVAEELNRIAELKGKTTAEVRRELIREGQYENLKKDLADNKAYSWMKEVVDITVETILYRPEDSKIIVP